MIDQHYPTVDKSFIKEQIEKSHKVKGIIEIGDTTAYVLDGNKPIISRTYYLRELTKGEVDYYIATGLAIKLGFMSALLSWFETNKNWKDGAYIV